MREVERVGSGRVRARESVKDGRGERVCKRWERGESRKRERVGDGRESREDRE